MADLDRSKTSDDIIKEYKQKYYNHSTKLVPTLEAAGQTAVEISQALMAADKCNHQQDIALFDNLFENYMTFRKLMENYFSVSEDILNETNDPFSKTALKEIANITLRKISVIIKELSNKFDTPMSN
jgi:hypothetical protein